MGLRVILSASSGFSSNSQWQSRNQVGTFNYNTNVMKVLSITVNCLAVPECYNTEILKINYVALSLVSKV